MIKINDPVSNVQDECKPTAELISVFEISEDTLESEWKRFSHRHILPSRMLKLAAGLAATTDDELNHLSVCKNCSRQLRMYDAEFDFNSDAQINEFHDSASLDIVGECDQAETLVFNNKHVDEPSVAHVDDRVPEFLREHLLVAGPVVFPDEHVVQSSWQFGLISRFRESNPPLADRLINFVAESTLKRFSDKFAQKNLVVVCFGREMHSIGVRIGAILFERGFDTHHIVFAHDFYEPKLVCDPREPVNAPVIVLVDVVHSGGLIDRVANACLQFEPSSVSGLALIDKSSKAVWGRSWVTVWNESNDPCVSLEDFLADGSNELIQSLQRFEPNSQSAISSDSFEYRHVLSPATGENSVVVEEELRNFIHLTGALRQDYKICGKRYPYVVNTLDLLNKDDDSRDYILKRSAQELGDIKGSVCIAYHKSRGMRAGRYGKLLGKHLNWPIVAYGSRCNKKQVSTKDIRELARFDHVVFVDSAIRTGDSLAATREAVDDAWLLKHANLHALFVFDALARDSISTLSNNLGIDIRTVFKIPMAPPTEQVRDWANQRKKLLVDKLSENSEFSEIAIELGNYLSPKKGFSSQCEHTQQENEIRLSNAIKSAQFPVVGTQRVTDACLSGAPHVIRHLSVDEVVQDSMVQDLLVGVMHNSMQPSFKENAAYALAAANNFDWMTLDWLKVNRPFLTSGAECWKSIVMIECEMKMQNKTSHLSQFRDSVIEYKKMLDANGPAQTLLPGMERFTKKDAKTKKRELERKRLDERLDLMIAVAE